MSKHEKPNWSSPDMQDAISVEYGNRTYYNPEYLNDVDIGLIGRFLNKQFGISPFREVRFSDDYDTDWDLPERAEPTPDQPVISRRLKDLDL